MADIVLNFENTLLRRTDVQLLYGPFWLNDQIISFYLEFLEKVRYKDHSNQLLFVCPEVVQCVKMVSPSEIDLFLEPLNANQKSFIFFPLNDNDEDQAGGSHWSLLVFSRNEQTFFHFDSFVNSGNFRHCLSFARHIAAALKCPEFDVQTSECVQQSNGYDCGVHVLCNIDCVAQQVIEVGHVELDDDELNSDDNAIMKITSVAFKNKRNDLLNVIKELGGNI